MPWSARFDDPIPLPRGRRLVTLQDAGAYITKLPKSRSIHPVEPRTMRGEAQKERPPRGGLSDIPAGFVQAAFNAGLVLRR
jgi:hypothetical protein